MFCLLVRFGPYTKKSIASSTEGDHDAQIFTCSIQPYHYLRSIPQGQLDEMEMTDAEKDAHQPSRFYQPEAGLTFRPGLFFDSNGKRSISVGKYLQIGDEH